MIARTATAASLLVALTGCGLDGVDVPVDAQLLVPDDVDLYWDPAFNGAHDGLGGLVPVDLMVYHGVTGDPLEAVELSIETRHEGAFVVTPDRVAFADPEDCIDCGFTWDAYRDQYFDLVSDGLDDGPADLGRLHLETDPDGLARVYVYVDAFPADDTWPRGYGAAEVTVTMALGDDTYEHAFYLHPR